MILGVSLAFPSNASAKTNTGDPVNGGGDYTVPIYQTVPAVYKEEPIYTTVPAVYKEEPIYTTVPAVYKEEPIFHVHTGDAVSGGGCYTSPAYCGATISVSSYKSPTYGWWRTDNNTSQGCQQCGQLIGSHTSVHGGIITYTYKCPVCGTVYTGSGTCTKLVGYALSCGMTEASIVGYNSVLVTPESTVQTGTQRVLVTPESTVQTGTQRVLVSAETHVIVGYSLSASADAKVSTQKEDATVNETIGKTTTTSTKSPTTAPTTASAKKTETITEESVALTNNVLVPSVQTEEPVIETKNIGEIPSSIVGAFISTTLFLKAHMIFVYCFLISLLIVFIFFGIRKHLHNKKFIY